MLGLVLLYFIWKYYSELAIQYEKNKWAYALLGIASYYAGTFVAGVVIVVVGLQVNSSFTDNTSDLMLGLMAFPFGLLVVWGVYKLLQRSWSNKHRSGDPLDADLLDPSEKG